MITATKPMTGKQHDLFAAREDQVGSGDFLPADGGSGSGVVASASIAWYAEKQREDYEAGVRSASAYWKARGVVWP